MMVCVIRGRFLNSFEMTDNLYAGYRRRKEKSLSPIADGTACPTDNCFCITLPLSGYVIVTNVYHENSIPRRGYGVSFLYPLRGMTCFYSLIYNTLCPTDNCGCITIRRNGFGFVIYVSPTI